MTTMYTLSMTDDGGSTEDVALEAETPDAALAMIDGECADWVRGGDWGTDGASVDVRWWLSLDGMPVDDGTCTVEVVADHRSLIVEAVRGTGCDSCGDDPDDHDWTAEGEGGCGENPGVWSRGGTTVVCASHCVRCGLRRVEESIGSQRNPGDHDTVEYTAPRDWCAEHQQDECDADHA